MNMSDSAHKSKAYCSNNHNGHHLLSGSGGFTSINNHHHHHNPMNISPLLTKSVSCFDPILNNDIVFNGTNLLSNERLLNKQEVIKQRK